MKIHVRLFCVILIAFCLGSFARCGAPDFEGIITWSISRSYSDPQKEAEIQAMLKSLSEQTGDSEPHVLLNQITIKLKDGSSLVDMSGDADPTANLYLFQRDKNRLYLVSHSDKVYRDVTSLVEQDQVSVVRTTEIQRILDYNCVKTIVSTKNLEQTFWTTEEIKNFDLRGLIRQSLAPGVLRETLFYEGIGGVPLRIEIKNETSTQIMQVTEIRPEKLDSNDFSIENYKEIKIPQN